MKTQAALCLCNIFVKKSEVGNRKCAGNTPKKFLAAHPKYASLATQSLAAPRKRGPRQARRLGSRHEAKRLTPKLG